MSLYKKTVSGVFWTFIQRVGGNGLSFIIFIVLARLLSPRDFGLIGMLNIFIQISQTLVDGGFSLALIQKKNADEEDYSSVFYINLAVSTALYFVIFFTAPLIATFYKQPILTELLRVISLIFIINAFSYVQNARLTKEMRFKTLMITHIPSIVIAGIISIAMALLNFGVWSIVAMQLGSGFVYSVLIWFYAKWKPLLSFNKEKAKKLFSFGGKLLGAGVLTTVYNNIFLVIIGKFFPINNVGYYDNAYNVSNAPSSTFTAVLNTVTFPVFSSIQDDNKRLREGYKKIMQQAFFIICPAYCLAIVLANPLFQLFFSDKWLPAVPYFQWLCIPAIFQPLNTYNLNILNVKGRSDIFLKLQLVRRGISIALIFVVIPFGMQALLILQAASSVLTFLMFSHYAGRFIEYNLLNQVKDILPIIFLSIVVSISIFFFEQTFGEASVIIRLTMDFGLGFALYWLLGRLFKLPPYFDWSIIVKDKVLNRFYKK